MIINDLKKIIQSYSQTSTVHHTRLPTDQIDLVLSIYMKSVFFCSQNLVQLAKYLLVSEPLKNREFLKGKNYLTVIEVYPFSTYI